MTTGNAIKETLSSIKRNFRSQLDCSYTSIPISKVLYCRGGADAESSNIID